MALEIGIVVGIYGLPFNQAININYDMYIRSPAHFPSATHPVYFNAFDSH